jgi:hypothetical protein
MFRSAGTERVAWKASVDAIPELPNGPGESVASYHFFPATILGGRFHVRGIPDRGPWDPARLEWEPEEYVELMLTAMMARKVRTPKELEAAMKEPMGPPLRGMSGCTRASWTRPVRCGSR